RIIKSDFLRGKLRVIYYGLRVVVSGFNVLQDWLLAAVPGSDHFNWECTTPIYSINHSTESTIICLLLRLRVSYCGFQFEG
ncbi:MAG: hypothetical protein AN485_23735, partial [Anabaena sp. MDT14b]